MILTKLVVPTCNGISLPNLVIERQGSDGFIREWFCSKTWLAGLLIRSIFLGKIALALQRECSFSREKSNELTDQQDMLCFNHASAFYTSNTIVKKVDQSQIQGTNSNRKHYRNF